MNPDRFQVLVKRNSDKQHERVRQGIRALYKGEFEAADRHFRLAPSAFGQSLVAMHAQSWERAAAKALEYLEFFDTLDKKTQSDNYSDKALMLRIIAIAIERLEEEPAEGAVKKRRESIVKRAHKRLEGVDWEPVMRVVRKHVSTASAIFGPLATTRLGRRLAREALASATEMLMEGQYHPAMSVVARVEQLQTGGKEKVHIPTCPHCFEVMSEGTSESARANLIKVRDSLGEFRRKCRDAPRDLEHALINGLEALFIAEYLGRAGFSVDEILPLASELLEAAGGLPPTGEIRNKDGPLLPACISYHRAKVAELRKAFDESMRLLEDVVSRNVEPWTEQAEEALVRVRAIRDGEARRIAVATLRERLEAAKSAGDHYRERNAIEELLKVESDDALLERLAQLELEAGVPGWMDRAAEAVRRGSRDPNLSKALVEAAVRISPEKPRDAIPLFRLASEHVPLGVEQSEVFAAALTAANRLSEAGKIYKELANIDPVRHLDAAKAYAACGEERQALSAVEKLLGSDAPLAAMHQGYDLAASIAPLDAMRPIAEKMLERDAGHAEAQKLLDRIREKEFWARMEEAARIRSDGLAAYARNDWRLAADKLVTIPEDLRDEESGRALAKASERLGRIEEALLLYDALRPSREVLEGRARCQARLRLLSRARGTVKSLLDVLEPGESPDLGGEPDLRGLFLDESGDKRGAAETYEDEDLLSEASEAARSRGDAITEYVSLARLANRHPSRSQDMHARLPALETVVPIRVKSRHRTDLPSLILCDTNVLIAGLMDEEATHEGLRDLKSPSAAKHLKEVRSAKRVRLAATRTVIRELRAVLAYKSAVEENEDVLEALRGLMGRADRLSEKMDIRVVAGIVPKVTNSDLERVREFYRQFRSDMRAITKRKAGRSRERSSAIMRKRTRGRPDAPILPETADLRLLAEAAWLVDVPVPGIGGVGILSQDSDFQHFRDEIEKKFCVKVY